jgi:hypothetical protein
MLARHAPCSVRVYEAKSGVATGRKRDPDTGIPRKSLFMPLFPGLHDLYPYPRIGHTSVWNSASSYAFGSTLGMQLIAI